MEGRGGSSGLVLGQWPFSSDMWAGRTVSIPGAPCSFVSEGTWAPLPLPAYHTHASAAPIPRVHPSMSALPSFVSE